MFIKTLFGIFLAGLLTMRVSTAQVFEVAPNPVEVFTTGNQEIDETLEDPYMDFELIIAHVKNLTAEPLTLKWKLLTDSTAHPAGWVVIGICDNVVCRAPYTGFYYGEEQTTNPISPGDSSLLELRVYAPVSSADGVGMMQVLVSSNSIGNTQSDTAVYILEKGSTSIDLFSKADKRIRFFPNPAQDNITLFVDRKVQANTIEIYNIIGAQFGAFSLSTSSEVTKVPLTHLAPGIYMMRVLDARRQVLTTRKFIRN